VVLGLVVLGLLVLGLVVLGLVVLGLVVLGLLVNGLAYSCWNEPMIELAMDWSLPSSGISSSPAR
jgi:hypothetical protein